MSSCSDHRCRWFSRSKARDVLRDRNPLRRTRQSIAPRVEERVLEDPRRTGLLPHKCLRLRGCGAIGAALHAQANQIGHLAE